MSLALLIGLLTLPACGVDSAVNQAVTALNTAIVALTQNSKLWEDTLHDLLDEASQEVSDLVSEDIQDLLDESLANASRQIFCAIDFIGVRVREQLNALVANLLKRDPPHLLAGLCQTLPIALDLSRGPEDRALIHYYGYNFDGESDVKAFFQRNPEQPQDISERLTHPSPYDLVLDISTFDVKPQDVIVLEMDGVEKSTVAAFRPQEPECKSITRLEIFQPIDFTPDWNGVGDRDFYGHGPRTSVEVRVVDNDTSLTARITMNAVEWDPSANQPTGDGTGALGTTEVILMAADGGYRIESFPKSQEIDTGFWYVDSGISDDTYNRGGGPVAQYQLVGDTPGPDAGINTKVTILFNTIEVTQTQVTDCVPAT